MTRSHARIGEVMVVIALVLLAFRIYLRSPNEGTFTDPKFALLTSEALLQTGHWDVAPYLPGLRATAVATAAAAEAAPSGSRMGAESNEPPRLPYQLQRNGTGIVYLYPPGTSVLSLPLVAALRAIGYRVLDDDGTYDLNRERRVHKILAALLTALCVGVLFRIARRDLALVPALLVALTAGFGSTLWSTASRSMWTHTWTVLLFALVLLELVRWEDGERQRPVALGALLVALVWVRPTGALIAAGVTLLVAVRHRAALVRLVAVGAAGLAGYLAYSLSLWGTLLPPYVIRTSKALGDGSFLEGLAGQVFSPSRGLLVASPILLAVLPPLLWRRLPTNRRGLAWLGAGLAVANVGLYSGWSYPGGGTPGPRFLTDLVPILTLLGVIALGAARVPGRLRPAWRRAIGGAVTALLVVASVVGQYGWVHYARVTSHAPGKLRPPPPDGGLASLFGAGSWRATPQWLFVRHLTTPPWLRDGLQTARASLARDVLLANPNVDVRVRPRFVSGTEPLFVEVLAEGALDGRLPLELLDASGSLIAHQELQARNGRVSVWLYPPAGVPSGHLRVRVRGRPTRWHSDWRAVDVPLDPKRATVAPRLLAGFYEPESSDSGALRWTSELASGELSLPSGEALLHLRYRCGSELQRTARVELAGFVPMALRCGSPEIQTVRIPMPAAARQGASPMRFELHVTPGFRPAELGMSDDPRTLGLQVFQLVVTEDAVASEGAPDR